MQLKARIERLFLWFLPPALREAGPNKQRQARLAIGFAIALGLSGVPFAIDAFLTAKSSLGYVTVAASLLIGSLPFWLKATGSIPLISHIMMAFLLLITFTLTWMTTGLVSTSLMWTTGIPLVAILLMGVRAGLFWTVACIGVHTTFFVLELQGRVFEIKGQTPLAKQTDWFISWTVLTFMIFVVARMYERARKEVEGQLEEANLKLAEDKDIAVEKSTAKSTFLASMSHEIRTPLNAIIGYTELLLEEAEEMDLVEFQEDLTKVNASGKHLLALINDILDLSKIEAGHMEALPEPFSVPQLVADVRATTDPLMAKNDNHFTLELEEGLEQMVADPNKVRQSLLNLLSNASKFTEEGQIELQVRSFQKGKRSWVSFRVSDTGIGMTAEQVGKLFHQYSQAEKDTHQKYGGTGLGLALSKGFCELMGGDILVQSTPGEGSVFEIQLPRGVD